MGTNNKKIYLDTDINVASVDYYMSYTTLVSSNGSTLTTTGDYLVYDYYGELYYFTAQNAADGLYITYTVPEPAEWAAMLGFAAIAFSAYKRRRK